MAFSANIGGIGTLIGTPVNLILQSQIETLYKDNPAGVTPGDEINFLSWMYFALPVSIVCNIGCWFWLIRWVENDKKYRFSNHGISNSVKLLHGSGKSGS